MLQASVNLFLVFLIQCKYAKLLPLNPFRNACLVKDGWFIFLMPFVLYTVHKVVPAVQTLV